MLNHPTLDQLHILGLHGMAKAFSEIIASEEAQSLSHPEWLVILLDREASYRREEDMRVRSTNYAGCNANYTRNGTSLPVHAWAANA